MFASQQQQRRKFATMSCLVLFATLHHCLQPAGTKIANLDAVPGLPHSVLLRTSVQMWESVQQHSDQSKLRTVRIQDVYWYKYRPVA